MVQKKSFLPSVFPVFYT